MNRRYLVGLFLSILLCGTAYAHPRGPHKSPAERLARLSEKLDLTDEQTKSVAEIFENAKSACAEASSRKERRGCMKAQRESVQSQVSALLNDEQKARFQEIIERREKMRARRKAGRKGPRD